MVKSILLHIHDDCGEAGRIAVALDLARAHQSHITCLQITPYNSYVVGDPFGGLYASTQLLDALEAREDEERRRIEHLLKAEAVSWDWEHVDGNAVDALVSHGRLADVLIVSRQEKGRDDAPPPLPIVADVAIHARAPVLVVPPGTARFNADGPVVVAWNGSIEAAHSIRLTLSFLRLAAEVNIVAVSNEESDFPSAAAGRYLARHGIASKLHEWPQEGRTIAQTLSDARATTGGVLSRNGRLWALPAARDGAGRRDARPLVRNSHSVALGALGSAIRKRYVDVQRPKMRREPTCLAKAPGRAAVGDKADPRH